MQKSELLFAGALAAALLIAAVYFGFFANAGNGQASQGSGLYGNVQQNQIQQTIGGDGQMAANTIVIETSKGAFEVELDAQKAPITVKNILEYAKAGFYDGTVFHRVIAGFMIQGGGFTVNGSEKGTGAPIKLEAGNGLKNKRGTIAMARTSDPDSATAQFFINLKDNAFLDASPGNDGYAVFGKVSKGMDVVDAIAAVKTATRSGYDDWPVENAVITKVSVKK